MKKIKLPPHVMMGFLQLIVIPTITIEDVKSLKKVSPR